LDVVICNVQLVIVWATGILVLVRCFSHREIFDKDIAACLGSSFSRVPYITVVVCGLTWMFLLHITDLMGKFFLVYTTFNF
jgi:palmitoyltransferase